MTKSTVAHGANSFPHYLVHCTQYGSELRSGTDDFAFECPACACKEAVSHYEKTPAFRKGAVFSECLRVAKRMAKLVQKKQRQQAREDKKKGKVAA